MSSTSGKTYDLLVGDGANFPDVSAATPTHSFTWAAASNSMGATTAPTGEKTVTGLDLFLKGQEDKHDMDNFVSRNKKSIKGLCDGKKCAPEGLQYSSWSVTVRVNVGKNSAASTDPNNGWGYLHPPVITSEAKTASSNTAYT